MRSVKIYAGFDPGADQIETKHLDVAVLVTTYNHERFIKRCLDSIIAQRFAGTIGIVVYDDCSTDGTLVQVRAALDGVDRCEIEAHVLVPASNRKSIGMSPALLLLNMLESRYVAFCEGDDAWSDPRKLEVQAGFLDANKEYSCCGHRARVVSEADVLLDEYVPTPDMWRDFTAKELQQCRCWITTCTLMCRGGIRFPVSVGNVTNGDNVVWSTLGKHGQFKYLGGVGDSLYTRHPGGVWSIQSPIYRVLAHADTWLRLARHYYGAGEEGLAAAFLLRSREAMESIPIQRKKRGDADSASDPKAS